MEDLSCKFLDGGYTVGTRGTIKPCCVMRGVPNQPFWENKHHQEVDWWKEVKSDLESGIRHPYCYACWNLEAVGERSTRNHGNDWFVKDWIGPITPWTWVDLKLGNLCNLQCRMCHAGNSTQIAKEIDNNLDEDWPAHTMKKYRGNLRVTDWYNDSEFYDQLRNNASKIRYLKFTGGEPTIISHVHDVMEWFVKSGHAEHIDAQITTNGTNTKMELYENMEKFKSAEVRVSVDGVGKVYEYIRYPHKWKQFEKNMGILTTQFDLAVSFCYTLVPYNLFDIDNFSAWFSTIKTNTVSGWSINPATVPDFMDVRNLPEDMIQRAIEYLSNYDNESTRALKYLTSPDHANSSNNTLNTLISHTNILDRLRNQNIRDIDNERSRWYEIFK